jgi:multidrug efflux pump
VGAVPLALSFGDGAEIHRPLGIGLLFCHLLHTAPVLYLYLDQLVAARRARHAVAVIDRPPY